MVRPGAERHRLAETLSTAYGAGLLSENTLVYRLNVLLSSRLIDPARLVGDITRRVPRPRGVRVFRSAFTTAWGRVTRGASKREEPLVLLALDWGGGPELLVGRHSSCDVVLPNLGVSRRHALLRFRDGRWILRDLDSRNGTLVNGVRVGRCELRPGDRLEVGGHCLTID